jgi:hypothetical protein
MQYRLTKDLKKGDLLSIDLGEGITEEVKPEVSGLPMTEKLERGTKYWAIDASVFYETWDNDEVDNARLLSGNCYATQADAELAIERMKILQELRVVAKELNGDWVADWNNNSLSKWEIYYDYTYGKLIADNRLWTHVSQLPYFKSEATALQAIAKVGEERIKKLFY